MQVLFLVVVLVVFGVSLIALNLVYTSGVIAQLTVDLLRYISPIGKVISVLLLAGMGVFLFKYFQV